MDMMYKCSHCEKTFSRRDNLLRHMKSASHSISNISSCDDKEELADEYSGMYPELGSKGNENKPSKELLEATKSIQMKYNALKRTRLDDLDKNMNGDLTEAVNPHKHIKYSEENQDAKPTPEYSNSLQNASEAENNDSFVSEDSINLNEDIIRNNLEGDYDYSTDDSKSYSSCKEISDCDEDDAQYEKQEAIETRRYWNNPNKLVVKLKELAETEVGAEIFKIITELKKLNIIEDNIQFEVRKEDDEPHKLLREIDDTKNAIREKYKALRRGRNETDMQLENMYKPITRPLQELAMKSKLEPIYEVKLGPKEWRERQNDIETPINRKLFKTEETSTPVKYGEESSVMSEDEFATPTRSNTSSERADSTLNASRHIIAEYFKFYNEKSPKIDDTYGVYFDNNEWKFGNSNLVIDNDDIIIKGKRYKSTMGLCELLFMKNPIKSFYTEVDLANYRTILRDTSAYKRYNNENEQVKGSKGVKYKEIISKLLQPQGMGLMQIPKERIDYMYWDDPNELVDRLRILITSQQAGNNNHNNEIVSIIEELREAEIIK